jgi:hypothetical protein
MTLLGIALGFVVLFLALGGVALSTIFDNDEKHAARRKGLGE